MLAGYPTMPHYLIDALSIAHKGDARVFLRR